MRNSRGFSGGIPGGNPRRIFGRKSAEVLLKEIIGAFPEGGFDLIRFWARFELFLQEFYRSFFNVSNRISTRNSSLDFHREFLLGFLSRIRFGVCCKNCFEDFLQESLPKTLQVFQSQISPWISTTNSSGYLLPEILRGFRPGISLEILTRNSSGDLILKFLQAYSPGISMRICTSTFFEDFVQEFLWEFTSGIPSRILPGIYPRNSSSKFALRIPSGIFSKNSSIFPRISP